MGLYALFRLLWRRLSIGHLAMLGFMIAWCLFSYHNARFMLDYPRPRGLDLFVLVSSALVGHFFVGQSVAEVQHTLLSWTLPDFRRRLATSAVFLGVATALPVSALYVWLGGAAPWFPVFTSVLLWYGLGILIAAGDVRNDSGRPGRPYLAATFAIVALFAAGVFIRPIAGLYAAQPILCAVLSLVGAALCLLRVFNVNAARQKSLAPSVLPGLGTGRFSERAVPARPKTPKRSWRLEGPLTGTFKWIRAAEYENFARIRGGWAAAAVRFSASCGADRGGDSAPGVVAGTPLPEGVRSGRALCPVVPGRGILRKRFVLPAEGLALSAFPVPARGSRVLEQPPV